MLLCIEIIFLYSCVLIFFPLFYYQFAVLLAIIFLVEIAAAIAGYVFRNKVNPTLTENIESDGNRLSEMVRIY